MTSSFTPGTPALDPPMREKVSDAPPSDMLSELLETVGYLTGTIRSASAQLENTLARISRVTGVDAGNIVSWQSGGSHEDPTQ